MFTPESFETLMRIAIAANKSAQARDELIDKRAELELQSLVARASEIAAEKQMRVELSQLKQALFEVLEKLSNQIKSAPSVPYCACHEGFYLVSFTGKASKEGLHGRVTMLIRNDDSTTSLVQYMPDYNAPVVNFDNAEITEFPPIHPDMKAN